MSEKITVNTEDVAATLESTNALFQTLWELTAMLQTESNLRKHHRPYLPVREEIDKKVQEARSTMTQASQELLKHSLLGEQGNAVPAAEEEEDVFVLSKEAYNDMVEDMLTMAELIDMVCSMRTADAKNIHALACYVPAFDAYEQTRLRVYRDAAKEAQSIMDRWDDAYVPGDEADEYFSD